jgi:hypothetical protein
VAVVQIVVSLAKPIKFLSLLQSACVIELLLLFWYRKTTVTSNKSKISSNIIAYTYSVRSWVYRD